MARKIVTQDGEYWVDEDGNPIPDPSFPNAPNKTGNTTPPTADTTFADKLRAAIQAAYPTKSKDANWLTNQVNYFLGRQKAEGPSYDEAYWLKRASGWQAGGADVAEAGDYAPGGRYYEGPSTPTTTTPVDWFDENTPPFEQFSTPERPANLQGSYEAPVWSEQFQAPDAAALYQDPGYQARLDAAQKAMQRSAAARGSILSGGTQVALGRQAQDLASQEYGNAYGRALNQYQTRYGQFMDAASMGLTARQTNEAQYQADVNNALSQYGTRYNAYRDAVNDRFRLSQLGAQTTTAGAPSGV